MSKETVRKVMHQNGTGELVSWIGKPEKTTYEIYRKWLGVRDNQAVHQFFKDDLHWIIGDSYYRHPDGKPDFECYDSENPHTQKGVFTDLTDTLLLEGYPWPDADYLDFSGVGEETTQNADKLIMGGMWCPFYHIAANFFGMENYFMNMLTEPDIVHAVTEKIVGYFLKAQEKFLKECGENVEVTFFGNDIGTQKSLLISRELMQEFLFPYMRQLIALSKKYNKKVMLHSCGAISAIIPDLIDMGVDILHPLQAKAAGMDAESLAVYKNDLVFVGGIDTQDLLVNAAPDDIRREVDRVRSHLGENWIVSPSHETVLPNVPIQNLIAMVEEAKGIRL